MEQPSPAPGEETEAYLLDEQVGFVLRQVQQRHATLFSATLGSDLTTTQWAVLAKLAEVGEISQNLLGRHTAMDNVTIKGVVERLVKRGLIKASRDAVDRRRFSISLSEEGRRIYAERVALALAVSRETLEPLSAGERREFQRLLSKLR